MHLQRTYRLLWKVAGEDGQILKNCDSGTKLRFALSGLVIIKLFLIAVISYRYSFQQIFNIPHLSWALGSLCTLMVYNLYKLNLTTISPNSGRNHIKSGYFLSILIRISFMLLFGLSIIKPMEHMFFNKVISIEMARLKVPQIERDITGTTTYFDEEIARAEYQIALLKKQANERRIVSDLHRISYWELKKKVLIKEKKESILQAEKQIDRSNYFIKGIQLLNNDFPWIWYLTFAFLFFFILPIFLKIFIAPTNIYIQNKQGLFKKIIDEDYQKFKEQYTMLFEESVGNPMAWEERYKDPPYNTIRIENTKNIGKEEDFLKHLYGL